MGNVRICSTVVDIVLGKCCVSGVPAKCLRNKSADPYMVRKGGIFFGRVVATRCTALFVKKFFGH